MTPVETVKWAAALFEQRSRHSFLGNTLQLMVNGQVGDPAFEILEKEFAGKTYAFGANTCRWQVNGTELTSFIDLIEPYLTAAGREKMGGYVFILRGLEILQQGTRAGRGRSLLDLTTQVSTVPKVDAFPLMDGVDEDQLELVVSGNAVNESGETLLRAKTAAHASEWVNALVHKEMNVHVTHGVLLRVERRPDGTEIEPGVETTSRPLP